MINIAKHIGKYIKNFLGFIDDCKSITIGVYTCIIGICILTDILINGGSNIKAIIFAYICGVAKLY